MKKMHIKIQEKANVRMLWPLLCLSFVPLIVIMHVYDQGIDEHFWALTGKRIDLFLYYKMWAIILLAIVMSVKLIFQRKKYQIALDERIWTKRNMFQWFPLFGYLVLVILSTCLSEYSKMGFFGAMEQYETVFTVIAYVMISYYAYRIIQCDKDIELIVDCQAICAAIVSVLWILQILGINFLNWGIIEILSEIIEGQSRSLNSSNIMNSSTLANTNYVGVYCVILIILLTAMCFQIKKKKKLLLYIADIVLLSIMLIGSKALTSVIALGAVTIILLFAKMKVIVKNKKVSIAVFCALIAGIILVLLFGGSFQNKLIYNLKQEKSGIRYDRDIVTNQDNVAYRIDEEWIYLSFENGTEGTKLAIKDKDGNNLKIMVVGDHTLVPEEEKYQGITIDFGKINTMDYGFLINEKDFGYSFVKHDNHYWFYYKDELYSYLDTTKIERVQALDGYENFISGRGYIWARTLPLLKHSIVLGTGRDSFMMTFPNNDVFGKKGLGFINVIITRPHNLYLQMMVQDGIIGTLLVFFAVLFYMFRFLKNRKLKNSPIQEGIFWAVFAYGILGLANDSLVLTAPIVWLFLGIGIGGVSRAESEIKEG